MSRRRYLFVWGTVVLVSLEIAVAAGLAVAGSLRRGRRDDARAANRRLVSELGLAGLALWSDASYCRHPALAEFSSAHADHPSAMEHFPAGSVVPPPTGELVQGAKEGP